MFRENVREKCRGLTKMLQHQGANKQDAVGQAAQMALKMYMKSEMGGGKSHTGQSGGSGGLMSLASRFL